MSLSMPFWVPEGWRLAVGEEKSHWLHLSSFSSSLRYLSLYSLPVPSVFHTNLIQLRVTRGLDPIVTSKRLGTPWTCPQSITGPTQRQMTQKTMPTYTYFETCMFMDFGRKLMYPERTQRGNIKTQVQTEIWTGNPLAVALATTPLQFVPFFIFHCSYACWSACLHSLPQLFYKSCNLCYWQFPLT